MDYMITTKQLTKKYKSFSAVNNVSLNIPKGSIYGLLGPNRAGKSTTMKMLLGLTAPTTGSFLIDGKHFPDDRLSILKEVGSFIESPSFYANLTGAENLDIIRRILGLSQSAATGAGACGSFRIWRTACQKIFIGYEAAVRACRGLIGPAADLDLR